VGIQGGARPGAGRPRGRQSDRTILIRAGLDRAIPDALFWRKVRARIEAGDTQMLIQVGKWKGLTERVELDAILPRDGVFRVVSGD
jgi:hypothetical protein